MRVDECLQCQIIGIQTYGLFVSCGEYEGLVHISELSNQFIASLDTLFKVGESLFVKVLEVDAKKKRLKLSYKQAHPIDEKITSQIGVKKGFHSLEQALPKWIESYEEKTNEND